MNIIRLIAAFARFKLKPVECLILEDHPTGLKAAYSSGAHVLPVENVKDVSYEFINSHVRGIAQKTDLK